MADFGQPIRIRCECHCTLLDVHPVRALLALEIDDLDFWMLNEASCEKERVRRAEDTQFADLCYVQHGGKTDEEAFDIDGAFRLIQKQPAFL